MRILQTAILLTSVILASQTVIASSGNTSANTAPNKVKKQGVVMVTQFPEPQVWINLMPVIGGARDTPTVDVSMTLKNNTTQSITYSFSSSQTFDIFIKDSFGNILSQWSRDLFFLQALSNITIPPGGSEKFGGSVELTTKDGLIINPGDYVLSIELTNNTSQFGVGLLSRATNGISTGTNNTRPLSQMPLRIDWAF